MGDSQGSNTHVKTRQSSVLVGCGHNVQDDGSDQWRDDTEGTHDGSHAPRLAGEPREEERGDERDDSGGDGKESGVAVGISERLWRCEARYRSVSKA